MTHALHAILIFGFLIFLAAHASAISQQPSLHYVFEAKNSDSISPRPDPSLYQEFYDRYTLHFISEMPQDLLDGNSAELFLLGAEVSSMFADRIAAVSKTFSDRVFSAETQNQREKLFHTGVGLLVRDENKQELFRISLNYWACVASNADIPLLSGNGTLMWLNRAVVSFAVSHGDWQDGYWTQVIPVTELDRAGYHKALRFSHEFVSRYPYLSGFEYWTSDHHLISPAVTCNTFVEDVIWHVARRDVYAEKLIVMGYTIIHASTAGFKPLHSHRTIQIFPAKPLWPQWYDEHGSLIDVNETPKQVHVQPHYKGQRIVLRTNIRPDMDLSELVPDY